MKKNFRKKLAAIVVSVLTFACTVVPANAATYGTPEGGTYAYKGSKKIGDYYHQLSLAQGGKYAYTSRKLAPVVKHTKNQTAVSFTVSIEQSLNRSYTKSWTTNNTLNSSAGCSYFLTSSIECSESMGYGSEYTVAKTYTVSSTVCASVLSNAETGYYSIAPGYTYYKMKDQIVNTKNGSNDTIYYRMPYGSPVIFTVYSKDNNKFSIY